MSGPTDTTPARTGASDRLNPVLVKEVRQALRGRYFMVVFWLTLTVATVVGSILLVIQSADPKDDGGVVFFMAMFGCLVSAVNVFVPFHAFLALGAEWEENAYDLLVLSNLRPRQIVFGKLLSALVQTGLFYAAFTPFLVFAYLLRGLDLSSVFYALAFGLVTSTCLSTIALALSAMTTHRFFRVLIMALLAGGLVMSTSLTVALWSTMLFSGAGVLAPQFVLALTALATGIATLATFAFAFACTRLCHQEENRSSALRVLSSLAVVVAAIWAGQFIGTFRPGDDFFAPFFLLAMAGAVGTGLFFATEEERLGRRVHHTVPRNPLVAALAVPFLPGGGRGFLFLLLQAVLVMGGFLVTWQRYGSGDPTAFRQTLACIQAGVCYALIYIGFPSYVFSFFSRRPAFRVAARITIPVFAFLLFFVPMLVGFALREDWLAMGRHVGFPGYTIGQLFDGDMGSVPTTLLVVASCAVLLNLLRVLRGVREVLLAVGERRRRGEPRPVPAAAPVPESERALSR